MEVFIVFKWTLYHNIILSILLIQYTCALRSKLFWTVNRLWCFLFHYQYFISLSCWKFSLANKNYLKEVTKPKLLDEVFQLSFLALVCGRVGVSMNENYSFILWIYYFFIAIFHVIKLIIFLVVFIVLGLCFHCSGAVFIAWFH